MYRCKLLLIVCLIITWITYQPLAASSALLPNTPYETKVCILRGSLPGPAVLVLGGVHGDEPAGSLAAEQLCNIAICRGTLVVIPRVNTLALDQGVRTLPEIGDINRAYPGRIDGTPSEQIAFSICSLLTHHKVSMLIDLHEGLAFHRLDKTSVGQTLLFAANERSTILAIEAVADMNRRIREPHRRFSLVAHPVPDSAAHHAALSYGIAAFTVETASPQPLADRVEQHKAITMFLLKAEGLL